MSSFAPRRTQRSAALARRPLDDLWPKVTAALKEQYAELMLQEEGARLEGWERRMKALPDAINDIHGTPLREAVGRRAPD